MKAPIRVILIEDNPAYSKGLCCALEQTVGIDLLQAFGTAEIALRTLKGWTASEHPNLVILDLNLPGLSGLDALPPLKELLPHGRILVLTQSNRENDLLRAIELGAAGYLLKSSTLPQLLEGLQTIHAGGSTLDPALASLIIKNLKKAPPQTAPPIELSKREREVLTGISEGFVQKQIADQLNISAYTVSEYIANIYKKLNVPNAPAAINKAHRLGLFS